MSANACSGQSGTVRQGRGVHCSGGDGTYHFRRGAHVADARCEGKALPFDRFIPNAETIAAMKEAREGKAKRFNSVEALMTDLNSED